MADQVKFFRLVEQEQTPVGRTCDLGKALATMDPELRKEVQSALVLPEFSAAAISRALKGQGFSVSEGGVRRCRRTCDCWKEENV